MNARAEEALAAAEARKLANHEREIERQQQQQQENQQRGQQQQQAEGKGNFALLVAKALEDQYAQTEHIKVRQQQAEQAASKATEDSAFCPTATQEKAGAEAEHGTGAEARSPSRQLLCC